MYKMHQRKAEMDKLYLYRRGGGSVWLPNEATYKANIISTVEYEHKA
jgi:hypothetical protein